MGQNNQFPSLIFGSCNSMQFSVLWLVHPIADVEIRVCEYHASPFTRTKQNVHSKRK